MLGLNHIQESIADSVKCRVRGNAIAERQWYEECRRDDVKVQLVIIRTAS